MESVECEVTASEDDKLLDRFFMIPYNTDNVVIFSCLAGGDVIEMNQASILGPFVLRYHFVEGKEECDIS